MAIYVLNESLFDKFKKKFGKHSEDNRRRYSNDKKPDKDKIKKPDPISEEELKRREKWNKLAYEEEIKLLSKHWNKFVSIAKREFNKK